MRDVLTGNMYDNNILYCSEKETRRICRVSFSLSGIRICFRNTPSYWYNREGYCPILNNIA